MSSSAETRDRAQSRYADEPIPLRGYAWLTAAFNVAMIGGLALAERSGRCIPDRVGAGDLVLMGVASTSSAGSSPRIA